MLRRNFDFLAIAIVALAMALISHIPPPATAVKIIRYQNSAAGLPREYPCPLQAILSKITN